MEAYLAVLPSPAILGLQQPVPKPECLQACGVHIRMLQDMMYISFYSLGRFH